MSELVVEVGYCEERGDIWALITLNEKYVSKQDVPVRLELPYDMALILAKDIIWGLKTHLEITK